MKKTKSILKRFSYLREYDVLTDVNVSVAGKEHHFDNLLVGCFGILSLCCFDKKGDLYGNKNDENFVIVDSKSNRFKTVNLIKKAKKDEEVIRKILSTNHIYSIKVDTAIVVENMMCNILFSSDDVPVLNLRGLKKHLNCGKFDLDNKADAKKIVEAILNSK